MSNPLLSVVIATKNREQYCIAAIESILAYKDDRIQIAISDNSETTAIKEFITEIGHPSSVSYTYCKEGLSFVENHNRATELAKGEYVIVIGDDDSILPNCVAIASWMKDNNIESISSTKLIDFVWPNPNHEQYKNGRLSFATDTDLRVKKHNNRKNLSTFMNEGTVAYQNYNLSRVYHGIVKKSVMDKIKATAGHYFGGVTPDLYSTIALSVNIEFNYTVDIPFTVSGVCNLSGTFSVMNKKHVGLLKDAPQLKYKADYRMEPDIPHVYSAYVVWTESLLKALKENKREELIRDINFPLFYAHVLDEFFVMDKSYLGAVRTELKRCFRERKFGPEELAQFNRYKKQIRNGNRTIKIKIQILKLLQALKLRKKNNGHSVNIENVKDINQAILLTSRNFDMAKMPHL